MSTSEERDKLADDSINKARKLVEKWNDRLTMDNLRLCERYLKGEIEFLVSLYREPGHAAQFCAVIKYAGQSGSGSMPSNHEARNSSDALGRQFSHGFLGGPQTEAERIDAKCHHGQQPMFVNIVEFVEAPEIVVPTLIRLERINDAYGARAHSLYLSRRIGFVFGSTLADGEVSVRATGLPVCVNQLPRQVVKAASQLVDCLSDQQREDHRGICMNMNSEHSLSGLRVILGQNAVWIGFAEGQDVGFQITDVAFGPFDFRPDAE